ncbi:sulfite exporter TauE/SafE family protein [Rhizobium sp. SL42]|uniref:sulfite exporter TauE/SafE family protein n=1 Tax=Rhizobium sp. SL42 TaxID=2806346 RepID=UPI001F2A008A|nr:sulfite exporter TauE/SafE family protein [Rhizobium sp. SL42]UJW73777.1 sulfite exporter TauE/SafE family protein [Rhizobium sp. SL42]
MPPLSELLMFAALLVLAGGVAGLLAGVFGIGGGAVLVPVFYQVFGWAGIAPEVIMHLAVGTSTALIVPTSIRSFRAHQLRGAVDIDLLKGWIVAVPLGALLATVVAAYASSEMLRLIFAVIGLVLAARMLFLSNRFHLGTELPGEPVLFLTGGVIGLISGLMGIGGGVLNNTFMTLFGRPIHQAVATSSGVGVLISIPALVGYVWAGWGRADLPVFSTGYVNWVAFALIFPTAMLVTPYGAKLAHQMSKRQLEVGFGLFLIFVSIRFFISLYG